MASAGNRYHTRLLRVLNHIQQHLDQSLTLGALAELAHVSPFHFHRLFRGLVGEGVAEHVRRLRLERASQQLHHSARPITDIAFEAGYESLEGFSRAFRAHFGQAPRSYRAAAKAILPGAPSGVHFNPYREITFLIPSDGELHMEVRIETLAPMTVVYVRRRGPYNDSAPAAFEALLSWLAAKGLTGAIRTAVGYGHDDPHETPSDLLTYDAGIELDRPVEPDGEVQTLDLPGGRYAILRHRGSYRRISDSFAKLYGVWLPSSGERLRDAPCLEIYRNDPEETPEEDLLVDLCLPLAD